MQKICVSKLSAMFVLLVQRNSLEIHVKQKANFHSITLKLFTIRVK